MEVKVKYKYLDTTTVDGVTTTTNKYEYLKDFYVTIETGWRHPEEKNPDFTNDNAEIWLQSEDETLIMNYIEVGNITLVIKKDNFLIGTVYYKKDIDLYKEWLDQNKPTKLTFDFILKPEVEKWGLNNNSNELQTKYDYLSWKSENNTQQYINSSWRIDKITYKIYQINKIIKKPSGNYFNYIYLLSNLVERIGPGGNTFSWTDQETYVKNNNGRFLYKNEIIDIIRLEDDSSIPVWIPMQKEEGGEYKPRRGPWIQVNTNAVDSNNMSMAYQIKSASYVPKYSYKLLYIIDPNVNPDTKTILTKTEIDDVLDGSVIKINNFKDGFYNILAYYHVTYQGNALWPDNGWNKVFNLDYSKEIELYCGCTYKGFVKTVSALNETMPCINYELKIDEYSSGIKNIKDGTLINRPESTTIIDSSIERSLDYNVDYEEMFSGEFWVRLPPGKYKFTFSKDYENNLLGFSWGTNTYVFDELVIREQELQIRNKQTFIINPTFKEIVYTQDYYDIVWNPYTINEMKSKKVEEINYYLIYGENQISTTQIVSNVDTAAFSDFEVTQSQGIAHNNKTILVIKFKYNNNLDPGNNVIVTIPGWQGISQNFTSLNTTNFSTIFWDETSKQIKLTIASSISANTLNEIKIDIEDKLTKKQLLMDNDSGDLKYIQKKIQKNTDSEPISNFLLLPDDYYQIHTIYKTSNQIGMTVNEIGNNLPVYEKLYNNTSNTVNLRCDCDIEGEVFVYNYSNDTNNPKGSKTAIRCDIKFENDIVDGGRTIKDIIYETDAQGKFNVRVREGTYTFTIMFKEKHPLFEEIIIREVVWDGKTNKMPLEWGLLLPKVNDWNYETNNDVLKGPNGLLTRDDYIKWERGKSKNSGNDSSLYSNIIYILQKRNNNDWITINSTDMIEQFDKNNNIIGYAELSEGEYRIGAVYKFEKQSDSINAIDIWTGWSEILNVVHFETRCDFYSLLVPQTPQITYISDNKIKISISELQLESFHNGLKNLCYTIDDKGQLVTDENENTWIITNIYIYVKINDDKPLEYHEQFILQIVIVNLQINQQSKNQFLFCQTILYIMKMKKRLKVLKKI